MRRAQTVALWVFGLAIPACCLATIWTGDTRWLWSALVMLLVLLVILGAATQKKLDGKGS